MGQQGKKPGYWEGIPANTSVSLTGRCILEAEMPIRIDITITTDKNQLDEVLRKLDSLQAGSNTIIEQGRNIMASQSDFQALLNRINEATNKVAATIRELVDKLKLGGLTATEETELFANLTAAADKLDAVGTEPLP